MKKYIAELIGTFVLVTFGCGSAVAANSIFLSMGNPLPIAFTTLLIAFAFGLSIVAMAYSIGNVSGCHVNPAVSLGMLLTGRMEVKEFCCYVVAQFIGATLGAGALALIFGSTAALGQNGYGAASTTGISMGGAILIECLLTFVFVLVVLGVTAKKEYQPVAGLVIGFSLTLVHIFGVPFTGTSVNPARSFGPAVFAQGDALVQLPVFICAPFLGAAIAALVYRFVLEEATNAAPEIDHHRVAALADALVHALNDSGKAYEEEFVAMREEGGEDVLINGMVDVLKEAGSDFEDTYEAMREEGVDDALSKTLDEAGKAYEEEFVAMREKGGKDVILGKVVDVLEEAGNDFEGTYEAMVKEEAGVETVKEAVKVDGE